MSGKPSANDVNLLIDVVKGIDSVPALAQKQDRAVFYRVRGEISELAGDPSHAISEYKTSIQIWPVADNLAIKHLLELYSRLDKKEEYKELKRRYPGIK